jgi:hypothetical protein
MKGYVVFEPHSTHYTLSYHLLKINIQWTLKERKQLGSWCRGEDNINFEATAIRKEQI